MFFVIGQFDYFGFGDRPKVKFLVSTELDCELDISIVLRPHQSN